MPKTLQPRIWEKGDKLYIVSPVTPLSVGESDLEEFAFAEELQRMAPNGALMWLRGQYVEADAPNRNGQMWTAKEVSIKSLTPMLMPVTIMHDERSAVGTIADTKLLTPDKDEVARARIDTTMALWKHRFPEVCEEAQHNYEQGTLMQSMECHAPQYSCAECGQMYQKLPGGEERKNWCAHLSEASGTPARILGNVAFTGTGLIFGSRGARGAYDEAHLEVFQEEVAEHHEAVHRGKTKRKQPRRKTYMDPIEVSREEYAELQKRPKAEELAAEKTRADEAEQRATDAEKAKEEAEIAKKAAEDERDAAKKKVEEADEKAQADKLGTERFGKLGSAFIKALPDSVKDRLQEQAKVLSDDDWSGRLTELSELAKVKPDAKLDTDEEEEDESKNDDEFSREEVAGSGFGGGGGGSKKEPVAAERASVMRGLFPTAGKN